MFRKFDRLHFLTAFMVLILAISSITRLALILKSWSSADLSFLNILQIVFVGGFYDLSLALYFIIPLALYLWLVPSKLYNKPYHRYVLYSAFYIGTFILLFNAAAEWFFWDEFSTRFNFIAVDYLVYTTEVIGNIQQSYPIGWIIVVILALSTALTYFSRYSILPNPNNSASFRQRTVWFSLYLVLLLLNVIGVNSKMHQLSSNTFANELAGNGMFELFAAYRNNELDYDQFYKRIDDNQAFSLVRELLKTPDAQFTSSNPEDITRKIIPDKMELPLNVVMISVESFSADFMGAFGNKENLTPLLDSLSEHSLLFTNLYATGTRTVRGLEALSLCVPPTPGQSIVRRPNNENLFSLGEVFKEKGYESKYIYGGYGYFDNMSYFFDNNGYNVVDRTSLPDSDIDYENIWGVADENLFTLAMREIDKSTSNGKKFFTQIMTTSNHRPFTYPDGRIDIPSHTNRQGAVKYTDYAIGKFIQDARSKPWFSKTMFVIVADHCAGSAGKTELPVDKYHIPMLIYSPDNFEPAKVDRMMSQIDIGPTLLGLLNFSYTSKFYGYDIFKLEDGRERVFISTYQKLGYVKDHKLVILSPQKQVKIEPLDQENSMISSEQLIKEAIAWYQVASYDFSHGLMKKNSDSRQAMY